MVQQTDTSSSVKMNKLALKIVALFSVVRWYNILLTIIAQYISAFIFVRKAHLSYEHILLDFKLHGIVLASVFSIAAGFIINNFYDFEKDLINRPHNALFHRMISKKTTLNLYIIFNLMAVFIAFLSSFKIGVFFLFFIAALWIYSHKLQKISFVKELAASILSITCFFAVLLHYNQFYTFIFIYGAFFMSLVYSRELVKQFINYNGDVAIGVRSIPVVLGINLGKSFYYFVVAITMMIGLGILFYDGLEIRNLFILLVLISNLMTLFLVGIDKFKVVNTIYKILIILGIINLLTFLI
jgi:4-hydroxybenzoate polyprenyltransferase